jgi:flagellar basal body P-ring protein FlgI
MPLAKHEDDVTDDDKIDVASLKQLMAEVKECRLVDSTVSALARALKMADKLAAIAETILANKIRTRYVVCCSCVAVLTLLFSREVVLVIII